MASKKRSVGRPTKYNRLMCQKVIAAGMDGKSKAQIARDLGISRQCWHEWTEKHEEFGDAVKEAEWLAMAWWEDQGQTGMFLGQKFNATAYIFQVKNRFPSVYRDRQEHNVKSEVDVKHTGKVEHTVEPGEIADASSDIDALKMFDNFRSQHAPGHG